MRIKKYFAKNIKEAIRLVRDDQGADAVILSNKRVKGGVEIVAAVDYDMPEEINNEAPSKEATSVFDVYEERARNSMSTEEYQVSASLHNNINSTSVDRKKAHTTDMIDETSVNESSKIHEIEGEIKAIRGLLESQLSKMAWRNSKESEPWKAELIKDLSEIGFSRDVILKVVSRMPGSINKKQCWRTALTILDRMINIGFDDVLTYGGVHALIGPTGVGKTTTIAKLASRFLMKHGPSSVALVSIDNHKVAAYEHLATYSKILGVTVRKAGTKNELEDILAELSSKRLILIDTAGFSQYDKKINHLDSMLKTDHVNISKTLVLPATSSGLVSRDIVKRYSLLRYESMILTKVDEAPNIGPVLSEIIESSVPVTYICDGQQVPENIRNARSSDLISKCVTLGKKNPLECEEELMALNYGSEIMYV